MPDGAGARRRAGDLARRPSDFTALQRRFHLIPAARELDAARQWMSGYHLGGIEGVVVKDRHRALPCAAAVDHRHELHLSIVGQTVRQTALMVRVELVATAHNMLSRVLAEAAEDSGHRGLATAARWEAVGAEDRLVHLTRLVEMPAVPPEGAEIHVAPYTEPLTVEHTTWHTDPDEGDPHVQVFLSPIDLDVLADETEAIAVLRGAGWVVAD
ncbi:MAG: hypothetical protein AB7V74_25550 [Acidimicrobiia bacterium]